MNKHTRRQRKIEKDNPGGVLIHGSMVYYCPDCGSKKLVRLEIGVEDHGKNGRSHQPCPFGTACSCGGFLRDISGYIPASSILELPLGCGMPYFAYDDSGKKGACGILRENKEVT